MHICNIQLPQLASYMNKECLLQVSINDDSLLFTKAHNSLRFPQFLSNMAHLLQAPSLNFTYNCLSCQLRLGSDSCSALDNWQFQAVAVIADFLKAVLERNEGKYHSHHSKSEAALSVSACGHSLHHLTKQLCPVVS